jgi:hypothetical protein
MKGKMVEKFEGEKFEEMEIRPLRRKPSHYLLKPEEKVTFSRYFFEKWVPLLGPTRGMVILKFRSFCAGKNSVVLRMADAAKAIGISERHLRRVLQDERVKRFIKKEAQFERDGNGEVRQIANRFWVLQEDPLTPEDEFRLRMSLGGKKAGEDKKAGQRQREEGDVVLQQQGEIAGGQKEAFKALLREGVSEAVAVRLVSQFSAQEILQQIEWLDYRKPTKNRAGMLVKAIEEGWAAPLEWEEEQRRKEQRKREEALKVAVEKKMEEERKARMEERERRRKFLEETRQKMSEGEWEETVCKALRQLPNGLRKRAEEEWKRGNINPFLELALYRLLMGQKGDNEGEAKKGL